MKKKDYINPTTTMEVVELDIEQQILAGSYAGIQVNNSVDDDVPIFDPNTNINPWDAN